MTPDENDGVTAWEYAICSLCGETISREVDPDQLGRMTEAMGTLLLLHARDKHPEALIDAPPPEDAQ